MLVHCYGACSSAIAEGEMSVMNRSGLTIERETAVWKTFRFLFSTEFMFSKDLLNPKKFPYMICKADTDL